MRNHRYYKGRKEECVMELSNAGSLDLKYIRDLYRISFPDVEEKMSGTSPELIFAFRRVG